MPRQMLPTRSRPSRTYDFCRVECERPAVVGGRELVAVDLLRSCCSVVGDVVAHGGLRLSRVGIETQPEDARTDVGVELPGQDVDSASAAEKRRCVAVGGG